MLCNIQYEYVVRNLLVEEIDRALFHFSRQRSGMLFPFLYLRPLQLVRQVHSLIASLFRSPLIRRAVLLLLLYAGTVCICLMSMHVSTLDATLNSVHTSNFGVTNTHKASKATSRYIRVCKNLSSPRTFTKSNDRLPSFIARPYSPFCDLQSF